MEEFIFKREKLRRDIQELLNKLDTATSTEDKETEQQSDVLAAIGLFAISMELQSYVKELAKYHEIDASNLGGSSG